MYNGKPASGLQSRLGLACSYGTIFSLHNRLLSHPTPKSQELGHVDLRPHGNFLPNGYRSVAEYPLYQHLVSLTNLPMERLGNSLPKNQVEYLTPSTGEALIQTALGSISTVR
jgi:hypothetical protein